MYIYIYYIAQARQSTQGLVGDLHIWEAKTLDV